VVAKKGDPLLYAAGVALAPIAATGVAAAIAPGRTVGSVVIALMIAVLAYLGGVVAALRLGRHAPWLAENALAQQVAALVCVPVLLGGVVAAVLSAAFSAIGALVVISVSALWAYRVGLVGSRDRLGLAGRDRHRTALLCALCAGGPAVTRAVLYAI
jgi:hypothetical protein